MNANNQSNSKTPASSNAPKQKPSYWEPEVQRILRDNPTLTRAEVEEMIKAHGF